MNRNLLSAPILSNGRTSWFDGHLINCRAGRLMGIVRNRLEASRTAQALQAGCCPLFAR